MYSVECPGPGVRRLPPAFPFKQALVFLLHALRAPTAQLDGYREWSSRCATAAVGLGPTSGSGSFPMYGTSIYNSLLMAGTMTDSVKSDSGKKDPSYPGESPTGPEFDAWEKAFARVGRILLAAVRLSVIRHGCSCH